MRSKMRKWLALLLAAMLMGACALTPAVAGASATPSEANGGTASQETEPTTPISQVRMQLVPDENGLSNDLLVTGTCEPDHTVNVWLCDKDGVRIQGSFNPHVVKRANTSKGTFVTTFTDLADGVYRVEAAYKLGSLKAVQAVTPDLEPLNYVVVDAAARAQAANSNNEQPAGNEPAGNESAGNESANDEPVVTAPTTPLASVQASLSGTSDIVVTGQGEEGRKVVITIYKGDAATSVAHTETISGGAFSTTFTDMMPNDYRVHVCYADAPDMSVFANDGGAVTVPASDPNAGQSDPNAGASDPNAGASDPNAGVSDPNAGVSDPNAGQSDPNAGQSDPNAGQSDPNAGESDPNAGVSDPNAGASDPNAGESDPNGSTPSMPVAITSISGGTESVQIAGTAAANGTVYITGAVDGQTFESQGHAVGADGSFSLTVALPGRSGQVSVEVWVEEVGNSSNYASQTVSVTVQAAAQDPQGPATLDLSPLTITQATYDPASGKFTIAGEGEPGQSITIQVGETPYEGKIGSDGLYSISESADGLTGSVSVSVAYKDGASVPAATATLVIPDPSTPTTVNITLSEVTGGEGQITVKGTARAETEVTATVGGATGTATADATGAFTLTIANVPANTYNEISVQYTDTANGNGATWQTPVTVTAPQPDVTPITVDALGGEEVITISGTAAAGAKLNITLTVNGNQTPYTASAQADESGAYSQSIAVAETGSLTVNVRVEEDGARTPNSQELSGHVVTVTPRVTTLTVNASYDAGTQKVTVSGAGNANEKLEVKIGTTATFEAQVDTNGLYTLTEYVVGEGDGMQVVVTSKDDPGRTASTTVNIPVPPSTVDIKIQSAVGGVGQVVLTGTAKPTAAVQATVGGATGTATAAANGSFSLTVTNVPAGDYNNIVVQYTDPSNGASATWNAAVTVTAPVTVTDITITTVTPEVGKVTVIGTAKAGERVVASMLTPDNKTVTRGIAVDENGSYTVVFDGLVSGTYKTLVVQYVSAGVGNQANYASDIVVPAPAVETPSLQVDKLYVDSLVVIGKTTPGLKVTVSTSYGSTQYVYSQNAGADGVFRIPLPRTQSVSAVVRVTVTYGENQTVSADIVVEKLTQKPTYLTLSRYKGSRGQVVLNLQERLAALGYPVNLTARYDYATEAAVREFQRINGLAVDGIAGKDTQTKLYSVSARPYGSSTPTLYPVLVRGDRGSAVTRLQQRLRELGYYTISVDGIYGVGTQSAVRAFQRINNLTQTGTADSYTQEVLFSAVALPVNSYTTSYVHLERGDRGSAVTRLQSRLAALGYYSGSLDGIYGSATQSAVRRFQSRNGIYATGEADVNTQTVLFGSGAIANNSSGSSIGYVYLHYGSKGAAVTRLQQALKGEGYYRTGYVDGIYGDLTYAAVKEFQRDHGLAVDGIAGRKTQNALYGTNY